MNTVNKIKLMNDEILVGFNLTWPVGVTYTQYPGQKSPMELWGDFSTWEVVKYGGAFFRTEGGYAKDFLSPLPVSTSNGSEFAVDWTSLSTEEQNLLRKPTNLNIGDLVAIDGNWRQVSQINNSGTWTSAALPASGSWGNIQGIRTSSAFPAPSGGYQNITKVFVLQRQTTAKNGLSVGNTNLSHYHNYNILTLAGPLPGGTISGGTNVVGTINTVPTTTEIMSSGAASSMNHNHSLSGDDETRSDNSTIRIWKRTL